MTQPRASNAGSLKHLSAIGAYSCSEAAVSGKPFNLPHTLLVLDLTGVESFKDSRADQLESRSNGIAHEEYLGSNAPPRGEGGASRLTLSIMSILLFLQSFNT